MRWGLVRGGWRPRGGGGGSSAAAPRRRPGGGGARRGGSDGGGGGRVTGGAAVRAAGEGGGGGGRGAAGGRGAGAARAVALERGAGDLTRVRRMGEARFTATVRRELPRWDATRPCLRIIRAACAAVSDGAGVIAHRPGALERADLAMADW